jgi:predicted GNAT family N-acyltransferase
MIKLRLAGPSDFASLRALREVVFRHELRIQEDDYEDVFDDHACKNFLLERDGRLVGAVRLAFSNDLQQHFISYLVLLPGSRRRWLLLPLVGAVILTMRCNGIAHVQLHASDENVDIYRGLGCSVEGPRFQKRGFQCLWTPMVYRLGTHDGEQSVVQRVLPYFPDLSALDWEIAPVERLDRPPGQAMGLSP